MHALFAGCTVVLNVKLQTQDHNVKVKTHGVIDRSRQPEKRWMNQNGSRQAPARSGKVRQGPARCSRIGGNRVTHFFPSSQMLTDAHRSMIPWIRPRANASECQCCTNLSHICGGHDGF